MPKISAKRQITIPVEQCNALGIKPGDIIESFVANGQITLVKKIEGAASGLLKDVTVLAPISDDESLESAL